MAPSLIFTYLDRRVVSTHSGAELLKGSKTLHQVFHEAEAELELHPGSYDFFDTYGKVEAPEDLQRALRMAGDDDCVLEVWEHHHFVKIRELRNENAEFRARFDRLETNVRKLEERTEQKIEVAKDSLMALIKKNHAKVTDEVIPLLEDLRNFRTETQRLLIKIQDKISLINIEEQKLIADIARNVQEEVRNCLLRVTQIDEDFQKQKVQVASDCSRTQQETSDLQKYISGKLDVLIETDADLRRDVQVMGERFGITQDDLKLLQDSFHRLLNQCSGALEESEELRDLMGTVREDNKYIKTTTSAIATRVQTLENSAQDNWEGFTSGVLYFRRWHITGKGYDVQLNSDLSIATGRGFLAGTGVVVGSDEGLVLADGPARRFGTVGCYSSYFELEVDETCAAPQGAGGLYVGFSIQSADEVAAHPKHEFDGWLMGGLSKALICRAGQYDMEVDVNKVPATLKPMDGPGSAEVPDHVLDAVKLLRAAIPPRSRGEIREIQSCWTSEKLAMGDRIGVLIRMGRDGGAKMKIAVNNVVKGFHDFADAPPAEAVGFLTPCIRLAGTGKSAKIHAGLAPHSKILAD